MQYFRTEQTEKYYSNTLIINLIDSIPNTEFSGELIPATAGKRQSNSVLIICITKISGLFFQELFNTNY